MQTLLNQSQLMVLMRFGQNFQIYVLRVLFVFVKDIKKQYEKNNIETSYALAKQQYADLGVDVDVEINKQSNSCFHYCWQGDDVAGLNGCWCIDWWYPSYW